MSARVIPLPLRPRSQTAPAPEHAAIDWSVHTAADAGAPYRALPGPAARAPHARRIDPPIAHTPRDRWVDRLCWIAFFALLGALVLLLRWWMSLPQEASRWIT